MSNLGKRLKGEFDMRELSPWESAKRRSPDYNYDLQYRDGVMLDKDDYKYPDVREAFG